MMVTSSTEHAAVDKAVGITLQELQQFIDDCYRLDMPVTTPVKARVGWKGQITAVNSTAERTRS